jgi:hypothetical protein
MLKQLYKTLSPKYQKVILEYKVFPKPRYGHGNPPNKFLYEIINKNRNGYSALLKEFFAYKDFFLSFKTADQETDATQPTYNNEYLPGLDIIALYSIVVKNNPNFYIEIGSGNSTKVVRKAIKDHNLRTKIISIDPVPRAEIDSLADEVIRLPLENLKDLSLIDKLESNDILFIDNSHRSFPNSDVTVCFLEIFPRLKSGVIVHVHDIYLPYDYPQFMCDRFYNEQYLLAGFILANPEKYKTILPNYFISEDPELSKIIAPFWEHKNLLNVERHGGSFWLEKIN